MHANVRDVFLRHPVYKYGRPDQGAGIGLRRFTCFLHTLRNQLSSFCKLCKTEIVLTTNHVILFLINIVFQASAHCYALV